MDLKHQKLCFNVTDDEVFKLAKNYNISEKMVEESLENIKEWYKLQPHLPEGAFEDRVLLRFLMASKFSLEKTKRRIDNMLMARVKMPEYFAKRDPFDQNLLDTTKVYQNLILPMPTNKGHRILIARVTEASPENFDPTFAYKLTCMIYDLRMLFDVYHGDQLILDLTHFKIGHAVLCNIPYIRATNFLYQECYCGLFKGIHVIRLPSFANHLLRLFKMMLSPKIVNRLHFHENYESLHAHFDPKYLPLELNGSAGSMEEYVELYKKTLQSDDMVEWFKRSERLTSDESKRIQPLSNKSAEILGTGSFRKLDID